MAMITLAKFSIRRPKTALLVWLIVAGALTAIGLGVSSTLSPSITVVPGTQSSHAQQLGNAQFGPTQLVPILLEGPTAQLNRQGPPLVRALARRPHTRVLSAWDAGAASASLRRPHADMIVVSVDRSEKDAVKYDQPQIEKLVARKITAPVRSYITGQPSIDRAEKNASLDNLKRNEAIAVGALFLLLLIGLRAPVAAALVTGVGAVSMLAGFGFVALNAHIFDVDPVAVAAGTMTGLALGVAFALLILDRFHREERWPDMHPRPVVEAAVRDLEGTGRAVLVAGTGLIIALALVAVIGPTQLMVSVGTGVLTCAAFATGGAVVVMPAALVLLGHRIEWGSFPAPAPLARMWAALVGGGNWVTRHAVFAGFAATVLLAAIAVPATALKSGPPDVSQLPASSQAQIAFQEVSRVMGPGWPTPYNMIVVANGRPLTTPAVLASIHRFEVNVAKNKTVASVTGLGTLNSVASQLSTFGPQLKHSAAISEKSKKDLLKLIKGLGLAGSGSSQLQSGLAAAASGAGQIQGGSGQAQGGAGQIHYYLGQALAGAIKLRNGAGLALNGANQLVAGLNQAHAGAGQSVTGLSTLSQSTAATKSDIAGAQSQAQKAAGEVSQAMNALLSMKKGRQDPQFANVGVALSNATNAISATNDQLASALQNAAATNNLASLIASKAPALVSGLQQLLSGEQQLQGGIAQLHAGNGQLSTGLAQLTTGAGALELGLGKLTNGASQLASGLSGGVTPAGKLVAGLNTMQAAVIKARGQVPSTAALRKLQREAPGIFNSGYFVLSAIEGATPQNRNAATFTINLLRGGTAGQIVVVSKYKSSDPRSVALGTTLDHVAGAFAKSHNLQIAVGGPAGNLGDLTSVTKSHVWIDVAVLAAAMILLLVVALRAVVLPIAATAFSLLTAAASFGLLQLLFGGSNPPMGGPGWLDPITIISVFTVSFALTIVFATVLLMRTREFYVEQPLLQAPGAAAVPRSRSAVQRALRETAAASTGAGLVMIAALIPFTVTDLLNVRALGIGVAFAILLDVVIVRPVLMPAAEAVLGRFGWWPTKAPEGSEPTAAAEPRSRRRRLHLPHRRPHPAH
jgi:RND superfamily putative drug exporter